MGFWADHLRRHCDDVFTIPTNDGRPYLRRYTLIKNKWFRVHVHEIMLSDEDRELHDHPWDFTSVLLSGGYNEERPITFSAALAQHWETIKLYWPRFSVVRHRAEDFHRIELPAGKTVWTLFIAGKNRRRWGFLTADRGWVDHDLYLTEKFGPQSVEADMAEKEMGD